MILVVDDEPDILAFLQVLLELEGYAARTAVQIEPDLFLRELPDLVLLDVLLSGKDGREIVKELKSQEATRHIPVIMFSAHPSASETALLAGADSFVAKPFEIEELLSKIAQYI